MVRIQCSSKSGNCHFAPYPLHIVLFRLIAFGTVIPTMMVQQSQRRMYSSHNDNGTVGQTAMVSSTNAVGTAG